MVISSKVLVFTPTFNEKTNIGIWLNEVSEKLKGLDLLVVDDSSVDGTLETLQEWATSNPQLFIHVRDRKSGVGSAHIWAIKYAFDLGYGHLIAMDADLSHNPEDIPRLLRAGQVANYVAATRNRRKGGANELPGLRKLWSLGANALCRIMIPTGLTEYTTSFRCYDRKAMQALLSDPPKNEGYSFFIEVTELMYQADLKLTEVPITFRNRKFEESKIPKMQIFKSAGTILSLIFKRLSFWKNFGGR
jgi:dolichol-phosphate mannosyltransferase